jgi:Subtilisin inhibitor-like
VGLVGRFALLLALALTAGCGNEVAGGDRSPRYDVTIVYWPRGAGGESLQATLKCDPDGGTHPDPNGACDTLLENEDALEPVAGDVACTQIYGGDQVATITGVGVQASFSRTNGCEIARWDALADVLVLPDE